MATAAITQEYIEEAADFATELKENGYELSFGVEGARPAPAMPPAPYTETGKAYVLPVKTGVNISTKFGSDVQVDDKFYFVSATGVDIEACTHMQELDGSLLKIETAYAERFDGVTVIYYEVQARA